VPITAFTRAESGAKATACELLAGLPEAFSYQGGCRLFAREPTPLQVNLEVSVIHEDTGIDDIYRRQLLELFIGIKWRRAEFESRKIHGADEDRTIDRRRSI